MTSEVQVYVRTEAELRAHEGHRLAVQTYLDGTVALECETCHKTLLTAGALDRERLPFWPSLSALIADAAEAGERFGDDELERFAAWCRREKRT